MRDMWLAALLPKMQGARRRSCASEEDDKEAAQQVGLCWWASRRAYNQSCNPLDY